MELIAFIVLLVLGFFTLIFENRNFFRLIYVPMLFVFIFIMRLNGFYFGGYQKDILTYAMFPDIATTFLQERNAGTLEPEILLNKNAEMSKGDHFAPSEFNITLIDLIRVS